MSGSGMDGMMGAAMMDSMQTRMGMMDTMSAERMKETLPMHRQMAASMLSQMSSEMRSMNMTADSRWSPVVDSIRQDLVRMPEMGTQELRAMMPAHHGPDDATHADAPRHDGEDEVVRGTATRRAPRTSGARQNAKDSSVWRLACELASLYVASSIPTSPPEPD